MGSLRNILNDVVDDNSQRRLSLDNSTPTPVLHSSPRCPASSDLSTHHPSSANYWRGDSPHGAYSRAPVCSVSRQHIASLPDRRDSTGINEPITHSSSHCQSHAADQDMPRNVMHESGVRLTPITGKVSRAKKGVPVHKCNMCPKTFTRAEHLRRHQLSHQPPDLACSVPGCSKVFHRKDLLERHQWRHKMSA
jgi:Zinc finger, C2H2 type